MIPQKFLHSLSLAAVVSLAGCANFDTSGLTTTDDAGSAPDAALEECEEQPAGTPCGDMSATDCSAPDTCDGDGVCQDNHLPDDQGCDDCPAGPGYCDVCAAGVCQDIGCGGNVCYQAADCMPTATSGTCDDQPDDCLTVYCMGGVPSETIAAGAAAGTDLSDWQLDDETFNGAQVFYCSASLPVTSSGVLTDWSVAVIRNADPGDTITLFVVRCQTGGGGENGPLLSECVRVGHGPPEPVDETGIFDYSLAGATQLDGAVDDPNGIVVETGDIICVDSRDVQLSIDCNGDMEPGDCPGPDFDLQFINGLPGAAEPFDLEDSFRDGTVALTATGSSVAIEGLCTDGATESDGTACTVDGGDTCCAGACRKGPSGPGTCD